jgi:peptidyl-prolyl cis-trans isomerase D
MAIIGKIRKHSGLAVIIIGVAIAAFVIGDFGKKQAKGTNNIGSVNGEQIPYVEFSKKVDETIEAQKQNSGNDKVTDQETFAIRESTWDLLVKQILMGDEFEQLGLTVSPEELFDQIQGKQPHRYILQYFKDPKTGQYDPALVINYLKNLDKMEPKARDQWLLFEKAIKDDRLETKFNNLLSKAYYQPKAFLQKTYAQQAKSLKVRFVSPSVFAISDSLIKLTDADYQKFYDKNKGFFFNDEAYRDLDYILFEVIPSTADRKKTAEDVALLFKDFQGATDVVNFTNANSDNKYDSNYLKKGSLPGKLDSLMFNSTPGTIVAPFEFNNTWYMGKLIAIQERPDSMSGSQILVSYSGLGNEEIKRTKEQAKIKADSLLVILKKNPEQFANLAKIVSDYPSAKEDGGDLKWFTDGNPNFEPFFKSGMEMKPKDIKILETRIGYTIFQLTNKTKPVKKVKTAVLARAIEPSNQTYQDTYMQASAFAGQNKTPETFEKSAIKAGLQKKQASNVKEMDYYVMGLPTAREVVRWAYAENTKVGDVSPVFDLTGKYAVAVLKKISVKGQQPLEAVKLNIEPAVKNYRKVELLAENMKKDAGNKDLYALAAKYNAKVDTTVLTFTGFGRSALGREPIVLGQIFTLKKGEFYGPLMGNFGAYYLIIDEISEAPAKEDYTYENMQLQQAFGNRVSSSTYTFLKKIAKIEDNRIKFF